MNELTLVAGIILAVLVVAIVVRFGKTIINTLAVAGLLALVGLGALVYLRTTGTPGQAVMIPQAVDVVQQIAPAASPTTVPPAATPEPSGWLGKATEALGDVAAVARVLKPEQKQEPAVVIPTPVVIRVPQQTSSSNSAFGTFCAGSFAMLALGAAGVAGWFYYQWQQGEGGLKLFERRWEARQREPRSRQLVSQQEQQRQQWQYPPQWQAPPQTYWMPQDDIQNFNGSDWGW